MTLTTVHWLAIIGFALSAYFLYVKKKQKTKNYKALCDITDTISCLKAARSKYGNLMILPNAFFGLLFYAIILVLVSLNLWLYVFYLAVVASLFSIFLIYISFKIKVACPVCVSTYIINFLILYFSYGLQ